MLKVLLLSLSSCGLAISAVAQTAAVDSVKLLELKEVVVEAPKIIRKADMDVLYPSESAVKNAKNGVQLLKNLMIPSLSVNEMLGSITAAGESV